MRRRSAVQTLLRVAELQEAVARGHAGTALAQVRDADVAHAQAQTHLADAGLAGGSRDALERTTQVRLWRADAVAQAEVAQASAAAARDAALASWTAARQRHRLVETLAERAREEQRTHLEKAEQALADELAGLQR